MIISGAVRVGLKAKCWKSRLRSTALVVLAALGIAGFAASAGATSISGPCAMLTNVTVATSGTATAAPGNIDANGTVVAASTTGAGSAHSQALISFEIVACGPAGATTFTPVPIDVIANGVTSGAEGSTDLGRVQTAVAFVGLEFTAGGGTTGSPGGVGSGLLVEQGFNAQTNCQDLTGCGPLMQASVGGTVPADPQSFSVNGLTGMNESTFGGLETETAQFDVGAGEVVSVSMEASDTQTNAGALFSGMSASVDPTIEIDPAFLASNPGYSLVFSPGFAPPPSAAIPEPTTWATLIVGFAGLGYAGWRRARGAAAA